MKNFQLRIPDYKSSVMMNSLFKILKRILI